MTEDIFVPRSTPADALVGPLHTVTYTTADKMGVEKAFCEGYGLACSGWVSPQSRDLGTLNAYYGMLPDHSWEHACFNRGGASRNIQIRVFHTGSDAPAIRPQYDGLYHGGATISFPMVDLKSHAQSMASLGFASAVGVKEMEFQSPTGEVYISAEIVYEGPDNIFLLGVTRPPIFLPVGPIDADAGIGGAAYSARCTHNTDATIQFLQQVMGYEIRRDVEFVVGEKSAINLPEGTTERFVQAFAPGSSTGYLVLMDHGGATKPTPAPGHAPPNRGIGIWSFPTQDIDEVYKSALNHSIEVLQPPAYRASPGLPDTVTLLMRDPDELLIEVFAV